MLVTELIQAALKDAKKATAEPSDALSTQQLHVARAKAWINALAYQLRSVYRAAELRVFSKYDETNRKDFGLNELLFDVSVCEVAQTTSALGRKELWYVKRALWQAESEFEKNSRAALLDFSKLVLGNAPNKLFVAPVTDDPVAFRKALLPVAECCRGCRVLLASVPHPSDFGKNSPATVHIFEDGTWRLSHNDVVNTDA